MLWCVQSVSRWAAIRGILGVRGGQDRRISTLDAANLADFAEAAYVELGDLGRVGETMTHSGPVYEGQPTTQPERVIVKTREVVKQGVGFGSALAIAISWSVNKSIFWAIIHGVLSWIYVVYYALTRN